MTPNMQMLIGIGVALMSGASALPSVQSKLSSLWTEFKPDPPAPTPSPTDIMVGVVPQSPAQVHLTVTALMAYFARQQDQEGLNLASAVGRHMYDANAKQMGLPSEKSDKKSTDIERK